MNQSMRVIFSTDDYKQESGYDVVITQYSCSMVEQKPVWDSHRYQYNTQSGRRIGESKPSTNIQDNCNELILGDLKVLTSPNYPVDYPPNTRCNYVVRRYSTDVCQVRLDYLNFDLEQSIDCRADYFHIDHTNEKFCGRDWSMPEKGKVLLIFFLLLKKVFLYKRTSGLS